MIKDFLKPSNTKEALQMKKDNKNSFYLGGGTKLNHGGENFGAEMYISLEALELKGINKENNKVKIGSMETLQKMIDSPIVPDFLKQSALGESNRNIRNASTIGGAIGAAKSWSTLLTGLMALESEVETAEDGLISVNDYVKDKKSSLILNVLIPEIHSAMYQNNQRKTANSRPEVCAAVSVGKSGNALNKAVFVIGGLADRPIRLTEVENKFLEGTLDNADAVQDAVMDVIVQYTEKRENGTYLNYISGVMVADCVGRCMKKTI